MPDTTLVTAVTTASTTASGSIGIITAGSTMNPIETKKIAANRSRNGLSSSRTRTAVSPLRVRPTRKAPTAAETCTNSASPATSSATPSTRSSSSSESGCDTSRSTTCPHL